jgi:hypothetical protein
VLLHRRLIRRSFSGDWNDWCNFRRLLLVDGFLGNIDWLGWGFGLLNSVDDRRDGRCSVLRHIRLFAFDVLFPGSLETQQHVAIFLHVQRIRHFLLQLEVVGEFAEVCRDLRGRRQRCQIWRLSRRNRDWRRLRLSILLVFEHI